MNHEFWERVVKPPEDGCWEWQGPKLKAGYGTFRGGKKKRLAHRVSYEMTYGAIPDDTFICHKCDNPSCVRPDHLFAASHRGNMADMKEKGRSTHGERGTATKLSRKQVKELYYRYARGEATQQELAEEYGVSRSTIGLITSGKTWQHLGLAPIKRLHRGGGGPGEACGHARLTRNQVLAIRKAYTAGKGVVELAREYQVSHGTISYIVHRQTWKHI